MNRTSPVLSGMIHRALAQAAPAAAPASKVNPTVMILAGGAFLGAARAFIPEKQKTLQKVAVGGSLLALAIAGILFATEK